MDLGLLIQQFTEWSNNVASEWGYFGIFIISLIGNASIIFPLPTFILTFTFAAILNPWLVGLVSAAGATLGELTGYAVGRGEGRASKKNQKMLLEKTEKWIGKYGMFPVIILFALTPLPDDIIGLIAGFIKYDIKHFLIATFIGKLILYTAVAFAGFYGITMFMGLFTI